jgi:hypothetical protein
MAARPAPHDVRQTHQSLHHLVAHAPWSDVALLQQVRQSVLPQMEQDGPVIAWIVDDTGLLKKGTHSVGVARQYCGQIGKQDNCQIAVSLSIATEHASLPKSSSETTKNAGKNWDWDITKVAAGEDFIIMPPYASPPMACSLRKEVVFSPTVRADRLELHRETSVRVQTPRLPAPALNVIIPIRSQQIRIQLARYLLQRLPCCPICGAAPPIIIPK